MNPSSVTIESFTALVASRVSDPQRLAAVHATKLLDTPADAGFDRIAALAARLLGTPFGFVTVVDDERSFWKSCIGVDVSDPAERQNRVEESFCQYVIGLDDAFMIDDTRLDPRTKDNPSIQSMGVLAWAGVPLRDPSGAVLGTLCVVDTRTRSWAADDASLLFDLAAIVMEQVRTSQLVRAAAESEALLGLVLGRAPIGFAMVDAELRYEIINQTLADINGVVIDEHVGRQIREILPGVADVVEPALRRVLASGEPLTGVQVVGSTPAQPGTERSWSANFYRLDLPDSFKLGMFVEETTARERARQRARRLASISTGLARTETLEDIETIVVHELAGYFDATTSIVGHWDADTATITMLSSSDVKTALSDSVWSVDDDAPYAQAIRSGDLVTVGSPADRRNRFASDIGSGLTAEAVVPCITGDGAFTGVMVIGWDHEIHDGDFPVAQLRTVGTMLAGAFQRNHLHRQRRELVEALGKSVLSTPSERPGFDLAVRYRAAGDVLGFGGDWYDVVALDDHRTALIIGDVAGHSPVAAARMSQIAASIAQLLLSETELTMLFSEAERSMQVRSIADMATVGVVIVDTAARTLTPLSAGHPPAMVVLPDGTVRPLTPALRPPLYSFFTVSDGIEAVPYAPGSQLVMFTDGLVERRNSNIDDDLQRLADMLEATGHIGVEDLLDRLLSEFAPERHQIDDIALIAARLM